MKCEKCGFIFNGNFDVCPYCGAVQSKTNGNILHNPVKILANNSVRLLTVINVILLNLFFISVILDGFLPFAFGEHLPFIYRITPVSFAVCFGIMTLLSCFYKKKPLLSNYERIDIYIISSIVVFGLLGYPGMKEFSFTTGFSTTMIMIVLPLYLILSIIFMTIFSILQKNIRFRPIVTELLVITHLLLATSVLTMFFIGYGLDGTMFNKFCLLNNDSTVFQVLVVSICLGLNILYFVNYNIILIATILSKVKYIYGK